MGKAADLPDCNKDQIIMAQNLVTSISETTHLVDCSSAVVVSTYRKWCMDSEMTSCQSAVCWPQNIDFRQKQRLCIIHHDKGPQWLESPATATVVTQMACLKPVIDLHPCAHHRQQCLQWAKEYWHWTIEEWKNVTWSNESCFLVNHMDGIHFTVTNHIRSDQEEIFHTETF